MTFYPSGGVSSSPSGPAGGSLTGTYPNPGVIIPLNQRTSGSNPLFGAGTTGDTNNRVELDADGVIRFGSGAAPVDTPLLRSSANTIQVPALFTTLGINCQGGSVDIGTVGRGVAVAEGTNAKQGVATLVAGTVTVANTSVTAVSRILLTTQTPGGTAGFLVVSARVAGTSFTILSSNAADTSVVAYEMFEPG